MARTAVAIELSEAEERELRALLRRPSVSQQQVLRARIVLRASEGASNTQIAAETGVSLPTVGSWRRSFGERRLEGLADAPRSGRPRTIDDDEVQRVLAKTLEKPTDGSTHWSVRRLAAATGISPTTVHRIWREHTLKPHQVRSFKFSKDPQLTEKVRDVIGLGVAPPKGALVLCVDEKTQIQALDRSPAHAADEGRQGRPDDPRLQAQRDHQPLRGAGGRDRRGHRRLLPPAPPPRVPGVPEPADPRLPTPVAARRARQFLHTLHARGRHLAQAPHARALSLHADQRLVDEHGRDLVLDLDQATGSPRRLPRRARTDRRDRDLHRGLQPARPAIRLDQDRRTGPRQGRQTTTHFRNAALEIRRRVKPLFVQTTPRVLQARSVTRLVWRSLKRAAGRYRPRARAASRSPAATASGSGSVP